VLLITSAALAINHNQQSTDEIVQTPKMMTVINCFRPRQETTPLTPRVPVTLSLTNTNDSRKSAISRRSFSRLRSWNSSRPQGRRWNWTSARNWVVRKRCWTNLPNYSCNDTRSITVVMIESRVNQLVAFVMELIWLQL